jgi:subtilase family serine protease
MSSNGDKIVEKREENVRWATWGSIAIAVIMILSTLSLVAVGAAAASVTGAHGAQSRAQPTLVLAFHGKHTVSPQISPYCNFGNATNPFDLICYTPQDLKVAYNFPNNLDGKGQTIVVVDAFGYPYVQSDLNTFDSAFGIPSTTIQIVCQAPGGCPAYDPNNTDMVSWSGEIALDTQYAHAMAPGAHLVLFVATSDDILTLMRAVSQAVAMYPHSVISQSLGDPELSLQSNSPTYVQQVLATGEAAYKRAAREGTTVFAAAGDLGADNFYGVANPLYPSSSPWVTAVGGTQGNPYYVTPYLGGVMPTCTGVTCSTGLVNFLNTPACALNNYGVTFNLTNASCVPVGYGGEQVWNEAWEPAATGGAPSTIFGVPAYQWGLGLTARATPDVSFDAAVSGGVLQYCSTPQCGGWTIAAGTSVGTPAWAGIAALANQLAAMWHRGTIGFINPALYLIGHIPWFYQHAFHDIVVGNNIISGSAVGYSATPGWDDATGWGTPNVANLVPELVVLSGGWG